jgi:hypothetical protein
LAAIIGGFAWAWIVFLSNYEIGYMAIGLGLLSGYFVLLFSSKQKGLLFQIIAVSSSVLGIIVSKYYIFYHFFRQNVAAEYGLEVGNSISLISLDTIKIFIENLGILFSGYDILWVFLAIMSAIEIVKSGKIQFKASKNKENMEILKDPSTHKQIKKFLLILGLLFILLCVIFYFLFRNVPVISR